MPGKGFRGLPLPRHAAAPTWHPYAALQPLFNSFVDRQSEPVASGLYLSRSSVTLREFS
jgi:hypothetical protein